MTANIAIFSYLHLRWLTFLVYLILVDFNESAIKELNILRIHNDRHLNTFFLPPNSLRRPVLSPICIAVGHPWLLSKVKSFTLNRGIVTDIMPAPPLEPGWCAVHSTPSRLLSAKSMHHCIPFTESSCRPDYISPSITAHILYDIMKTLFHNQLTGK